MKKEINFESALEQIEGIIENLEDGTANLQSSVDLYKKGSELIKYCQDKLNAVEQQIKILNQDSGSLENFSEK
jgi:exodeoxyribonuclease VII small subunit